MFVDGVVFQNYSTLTNISITLDGSVSVSRPENNSFLVAFPSGISVTITEVQGSLSIVFAAPTNFKGQTKGLLGTWNDNVVDDFLRPDNTTLPSNSTGRQIHFDFGLKCKFYSPLFFLVFLFYIITKKACTPPFTLLDKKLHICKGTRETSLFTCKAIESRQLYS